jgi:hypothetical protein
MTDTIAEDAVEAPASIPGMHLRPLTGETLEDILAASTVRLAGWGGSTATIEVDLEKDKPTIRFGTHEVPATKTGLDALGVFFEVPVKFLDRIQPDEQQYVLSRRIERSEERSASIRWTTEGIAEILPASARRIDPEELVAAVGDVFPSDSPVVQYVSTGEHFLLDVIVPDSFKKHIGGDRKVGDITKGGCRFYQDRKRNLSPSVQTILYRLACTNGMEIPDHTLKIDARGAETFDILSQLKTNARTALDQVNGQIKAFYDLRSQKLGDDRTGVLHRMARENGLPTRTVVALEDALPAYLSADFGIDDVNQASMFHIANLITNAANSPVLADSLPSRLRLERLGGAIVNDHIARCQMCHSALN